MTYRKHILTSVLIAFVFLSVVPTQTLAQTDIIPPVPVSDSAVRNKEVGITIFGFTVPGVSLDSLIITAAKILIGQIVDSTVNWINTGFEGNPAYVTNPGQYFTDIADGIAGEFIAGSDLNFLCSPFQAQIRLTLKTYYAPPVQYQCTFTEAVGNLENFYSDFNQGGWDGWLAMTQNSANNPYDAYLAAQIELDNRLAKRLGIENKQLQWNQGFLSWSECIKNDPDTGVCLERGPVKTPGKVIDDQLSEVLGTGFSQLELADEFDEIVGALISLFLNEVIFNSGIENGGSDNAGLIKETPYQLDGDQFASPPTSAGGSTGTSTGTGSRGTGGLPTGANNYGCVGIGCTPCSGTDCGVGKTVFGEPAINGVYAGSCLVNIVASFWTSVAMTQDQCNLVNQVISDGITFAPSGRAIGGTYSNAIKAVALVCGGDGGGISEDASASHYICGFP
ncbi:MAG: hypothetical protein COV96_00285 [Candidatus Zambryskibacteria bacterium CG11_big_fil_rev_8_21_14_0_20_42_18]|nr:MAG: hypothetical protein COV96_00285 [Candidatus Zambryskibacteria bacterium CG11_big_fil_rev_8_21_14_0_20_42_18]